MAGSLKVGIVLLPDAETEAYVRKLAINQPKSKTPPNFIPHLSLLHVVVADLRLPEMCKTIDQIKLPKRILLECCGVVKKNRYRFLNVRKSEELRALQKQILPIAELRCGDTDFSWRYAATAVQKRSQETYGYPNVGAGWDPHFTFGVVNDQKIELPQSQGFWNGHVRAIALGILGSNSTILKILHSREFSR